MRTVPRLVPKPQDVEESRTRQSLPHSAVRYCALPETFSNLITLSQINNDATTPVESGKPGLGNKNQIATANETRIMARTVLGKISVILF